MKQSTNQDEMPFERAIGYFVHFALRKIVEDAQRRNLLISEQTEQLIIQEVRHYFSVALATQPVEGKQ